MQSSAKTVDEYLTEVPADRLSALREIRRLCRLHLTGFEESMAYGMAGYSRDGVVEVAFASQKNNIALYILRTDVLEPHRASFPASAIGKGCIRYRNPNRIDFDRVEAMLIATANSRGPVC
jgi:uncharacterized protein YdhG (YjbR/CyaY superfamily)